MSSLEELEDSLKESESESESAPGGIRIRGGQHAFLLVFYFLSRRFLDDIAHRVLVYKAVLGEPSDDPIFSLLLLFFLLPFGFPSYHLFDVGGRFLRENAALGDIVASTCVGLWRGRVSLALVSGHRQPIRAP